MAKETKWIKTVTRPMSPLKFPMITALAERFQEPLGVSFEHQIYFPAAGQHSFYFDEDEFSAFREAVLRKIREKHEFIADQARICYQTCEAFVAMARDIATADIGAMSGSELANLYSAFNELIMKYTVYLWIPLIVERYLPAALERSGKLGADDLETVSTKTRLTPSDRERIDLLRIAVELEDNQGILNDKIDKMVENHAAEYGWLPTHDFHLEAWDKAHFLARLKQISDARRKLAETEGAAACGEEKLAELKERLRSDEALTALIDELQEYLFLRTYRTDALYQAIHHSLPLIWEIAKRGELSREFAVLLAPWEVLELLQGRGLPDLQELDRRKKRYVLSRIDGREEIISDPTRIDQIGTMLAVEEVRGEVLLRGQGVYRGYARGAAKIVLPFQEGANLERGNVLVSTMTTPDMHSIIEKASAIVTDEGGVTSHAALISRELGIPCVMGTGNATKVLRDGDLVEVDSSEGIVRKL